MAFPGLQPPPNTFSSAELGASNKHPVYIAVIISLVLATGAVLLRGKARHMSKAAFGWDDYSIIFALLGLANITLWLATAAATKASLLLLYYRLFSPSERFRLAVYIGAAVVFCQWFSLTIVTIFQCRPVRAFWNRNIQNARCFDLARVTIISGVLNILTDVLILCLPVPMVWGLRTTFAQKVTVTGMFLLGIFVCAISIVRISKLAVINSIGVLKTRDPTWSTVDIYIWTVLESGIGILSACLPTLRPLFGQFLRNTSRSRSSKLIHAQPSSQRRSGLGFDRLSEEAEPEVELQVNKKEKNGARMGPDSSISNQLFSTDNAFSRPLHSINSTSQLEDRVDLNNSTWRASYE
ncbi:hypothetical protein BDR22DRAFT_902287 [Usnea florida]